MPTKTRQLAKNPRRSIPAFFFGAGVVCLIAAAVGGQLALGLTMLGAMAGYGLALLLLARRSEAYQGLTAETSDERFALIKHHAWAGTGLVLALANLGEFIGRLVGGRSGDPYPWLPATAGVTYIALVAILRRSI